MKFQNFSRFYQERGELSAYYNTPLINRFNFNKMPYDEFTSKYQPYCRPTFLPKVALPQMCATPQQQQSHPPPTVTANNNSTWACDFCQIATFRTYEEAYIHEQACPMNSNDRMLTNHNNDNNENNDLLRKKIVESGSGSGPPCLAKPHMTLSMARDKNSLSDRQCYVRSHFVETFAATEADVAARHSKGAQKLHSGQIGIRCKFCANIPQTNRAERAVCYPSSISRIYQTVADMQRFHFEVCTAIPEDMKRVYKSMKTTRPRGMGSPQLYWISSAKELGLIDTDKGISLTSPPQHQQQQQAQHTQTQVTRPAPVQRECSLSESSTMSTPEEKHVIVSSLPKAISPTPPKPPQQPPTSPTLSTASHSTAQSLFPTEQCDISSSSDTNNNNNKETTTTTPNRDLEANMLLALRNSSPNTSCIVEKCMSMT